ncbi:MAG: type II toxin-antitoxin system prevent-host-death family antitoxin [Thiolinea sp.]
MQQVINLREANQHLSRHIKNLAVGDEILITKHGKPVARLLPVTEEEGLSEEKKAALARLRKRSRNGYQLGGQGVNREALYE